MKIGSLFDGSGGFPLAASLCGIEPVWASEIEPYPIAVTRSRFPNMKHLGSVTDIRGDEIEPVDVITFGSPCQDLSVAGKRAGLKHTENGDDETTRSGLFMEAVRIIKEMRKATNGEYPRYAIWENVPGAFSSNKGLDFRVVLEELIRIAEPTAVMPEVPKAGWPYADVYCGDGWSLAYRVFDAQLWGVPQRRRRIYLVADFRGQCAGKISFEREGLRGYLAESGTQREATAGDAENCVGTADREGKCYGISSYESNAMKSSNPHSGIYEAETARTLDLNGGNPACNQGGIAVVEPVPYTLKIRGGVEVDSAGKASGKGALIQKNMSATLAAAQDQYLFQPVCSSGDVAGTLDASYFKGCGMRQGVEREYVVQPVGVMASSAVNAEVTDGSISPCLMARAGTGGNQLPLVVVKSWDARGNGDGDIANTITGDHENRITDYTSVVVEPTSFAMQGFGDYKDCGVVSGLKARDYKDATDLVVETPIALDRAFYNQGQNAQYDPQFYTDGTVPTLVAKGPGAVAIRYVVRRLTPTECARLQGFPDTWGHPDVKTELTDEEYAFWLNVRNAHAEINDKATKEYTREQMLTWYNKLHTDSSEYKLWGNGIALPCALYVMQGIAEVSNEN